MNILRLPSIRVRLNGLFLVVLLLFALLGLLPQAILIFSMVLIHEGFHLLTASLLGIEVEEVELLPFGGVARLGEELALYPQREILIALMGPLSSIMLGVVAYMFCSYHHLLPFLARINMTIGLFNLTPALPLDGGRILRSILTTKMGLYGGTKGALFLSKVLALLLGGLSIYGVLRGMGSIFLLIISFFVYYAAGKEDRGISTLMMKYILRKREDYRSLELSLMAIMVVRSHLTLRDLIKHLFPHRLHLFYVVDQDLSLLGVLLEMDIIEHLIEGEDLSTKVGTLLGE